MEYKRLISAFTVTAVSVTLFMGSASADTLNNYEKRKQSVDSKIKETRTQITTVDNQKKKYLQDLNNINSKINDTNSQLQNLQSELNKIQENCNKSQEELNHAQNSLNKEDGLYKERLKAMYINGPTGYIEVLLDSSSFSDFISRLDMIQRVVKYDEDLLKEMKSKRDSIESEKRSLLSQKAELLSTKNQIDVRKRDLKNQETDRSLLVSRLSTQKNELKADLEKQERESAEIGNIIKKSQVHSKLTYTGGAMGWPAPDYVRISSPYGWRFHPVLNRRKLHTGVDLASPSGSRVLAAADGEVIFAGSYGGYGNAVIIDHGSGLSTLYGHNSSLMVGVGEKVKRGQQIARVGSTGLATGPHVHFEVRKSGSPVDPMPYLK
jgi:murein DD-endopeptidase MepM/ murein hydrolase activator NlpD